MAIHSGNRKRKREAPSTAPAQKPVKKAALSAPTEFKKKASAPKGKLEAPSGQKNGSSNDAVHLQIVTGSYERVLHGIAASIPRSRLHPTTSDQEEKVTFSDSFLFAAHANAIRCLAISPSESAEKCILATGSTDERINLYSLSTAPPSTTTSSAPPSLLPSLTGTPTSENPRNKSLGSLVHHDRAITKLHFPSKSKLFSAAEDATICISRTRDWTVLSSIKAPIPKPQGRPSGDTAGPGESPTGINDFAVHPSQKLMLSVGRAEKCMRLWNLMTGKKAGVLNFDRELLTQVGESKFSSGEGRRILFDATGESYVIGFERGAAIFGLDSKPKAVLKFDRPTKLHAMKFLPWAGAPLAISTEDGRVLFFDIHDITEPATDAKQKFLQISCLAQLGGTKAGLQGRIKDFECLKLVGDDALLVLITASSDGGVRLWKLRAEDFLGKKEEVVRQVGNLIALQETGDRITCMGAFVLDGKVGDGVEEAVEEMTGADFEGSDEEEEEDSD